MPSYPAPGSAQSVGRGQAPAGDPGRRGFSVLSTVVSDYWIARSSSRTMTIERGQAFPRRDAPELCVSLAPSEMRAQGRPGAGRARGPAAKQKAGGSHHRFGRAVRPSLRDGFNGVLRAPRGPGFLAPVANRSFRSLGISVGIPGPHDFAVRVDITRPRKDCALISSRPPHPASRFVTIAHTPLMPRRDGRSMHLIWEQSQIVF
jgi:hypothetical protein